MDEPFGALDPYTRWEMQGLLLDVSRVEDNTILFVTHDVSEAVYLADTVYVLSRRPAQVLHRVDVPFFGERDIALKSSSEFRAVEKTAPRDAVRAGRPSPRRMCAWRTPDRSEGRPPPLLPESPGTRVPPPPPALATGHRRRGEGVGEGGNPREASLLEAGVLEPLQPVAVRRRHGRRRAHPQPVPRDRRRRPRGALAALRARLQASAAPAVGPEVRQGARGAPGRGARPAPRAAAPARAEAGRPADGPAGADPPPRRAEPVVHRRPAPIGADEDRAAGGRVHRHGGHVRPLRGLPALGGPRRARHAPGPARARHQVRQGRRPAGRTDQEEPGDHPEAPGEDEGDRPVPRRRRAASST